MARVVNVVTDFAPPHSTYNNSAPKIRENKKGDAPKASPKDMAAVPD